MQPACGELERDVEALYTQYRELSGGLHLCVQCGTVFNPSPQAEGRGLAECGYHSGAYVVNLDGEGFFACCQARDDIYWGGAPLYPSLIPQVANKGPVYVSSGGCCRAHHVGVSTGRVDKLPEWKLRMLKRKLSSLVDDSKRLHESDRKEATRVLRGLHNSMWDVADGISFFDHRLTFTTPSCQGSAKNDAPIINTGLRIWDGAIVLAKYLEHKYDRGHWMKKRVLEVGAGCGLVGLSLSTQGAHVVLTDRQEVLPTLQENLQRNMHVVKESEDICVKELDWRGDSSAFVGDGTGGFDYIMAADVIGFPAVLDILATTLHTLMFSPCVTRATQCIMSFKMRDARVETSFLDKMREKGFSISEVPHDDMHPSFQADSIRIVIFTR